MRVSFRTSIERYTPAEVDESRYWLAESLERMAIAKPGSFTALRADRPEKGFGNLVLRAGLHYLFDATISQASRPAGGIHMPDIVLLDDVPLAFWRGEGFAASESPDGSIIRYEPNITNTGYLQSPAWALRRGIEAAAYSEIIALLTTVGGLRSRRPDPEAA